MITQSLPIVRVIPLNRSPLRYTRWVTISLVEVPRARAVPPAATAVVETRTLLWKIVQPNPYRSLTASTSFVVSFSTSPPACNLPSTSSTLPISASRPMA